MSKQTKRYLIISGALAFFGALALFLIGPGSTAALNVNDVGSDPAAFSGDITITGIVAGVSQQDPAIIGMMDKRELQCTTPNCNKIYIPFKAAEYTPNRGDEVRIKGRFVTTAVGYVFMADNVKVVRTHRIGG
jgi:hypothetical protein